ncbi:MAG: hypothetical protein LBJ46_04340 [Planctomycetota bacterium]|jgi:hypothetical protein|nr:hypothetical protein [Planctomycetota bacterium]
MRMTPHYPETGRIVAAFLLLTLLILATSGCGEPINVYRVSGRNVDPDSRVLVLPFLDTRTFVDPRDPYKDTLGGHARDIFVAAMREHPLARDCEVIAPEMTRPEGSMTLAEVADHGRRHGADYIVAGQIFSYTGTRAASIPPRAGMFIRIVSAHDGSLVFVGDHYQSAPVPGAAGGRELQARNVSTRLIEGFVAGVDQDAMAARSRRRLRSDSAFASVGHHRNTRIVNGNEEELPPLPPLPVVFNGEPDKGAWAEIEAPAIPVILEYDDFFTFEKGDADTAEAAVETAWNDEYGIMDEFAADAPLPPAPPPVYAELREENSAEGETPDVAAAADGDLSEFALEDAAEAEADVSLSHLSDVEDLHPLAPPSLDGDEPAKTDADIAAAPKTEGAEAAPAVNDPETPEVGAETEMAAAAGTTTEHVEYADSYALKSGDEMAADLFGEEMLSAMTVLSAWHRAGEESRSPAAVSAAPVEMAAEVAPATSAVEPMVADVEGKRMDEYEAARIVSAVAGAVLRPGLALGPPPTAEVVSESIDAVAIEQPTPVHMVDMVAAAISADAPTTVSAIPANGGGSARDVKILFLPYHDRENPSNLIPHTGGGEVVTALFGARLAMEQGMQVMWPEGWFVSHDRLPTVDEAIQIGSMAGVDYVVRGQVVEFRRAQSVPSFYSAVISTAVLAAQMVFAEMSGVDVATEVYRVSDGKCVVSRRDRSQQKYVVQAEKTVRKLAIGMAASVSKAVLDPAAEAMDSLIDGIEPISMLGNLL